MGERPTANAWGSFVDQESKLVQRGSTGPHGEQTPHSWKRRRAQVTEPMGERPTAYAWGVARGPKIRTCAEGGARVLMGSKPPNF